MYSSTTVATDQGNLPGFLKSLEGLLSSHGIKLPSAVKPQDNDDRLVVGPSTLATNSTESSGLPDNQEPSPGTTPAHPDPPVANTRRSSSYHGLRGSSRSTSPAHRVHPFAYNDEALGNAPIVPRTHSPVPSPQFAYHYDVDGVTPLTGTNDSPADDNFGTLVVDNSGRSRYLGPTAGPEWMKDQGEARRMGQDSRAHSPNRSHNRRSQLRSSFPFEAIPILSIDAIVGYLPPYEHAHDLLQSYYRYFAWNHRPASEASIQLNLQEAYSRSTSATSSRIEFAQKLALLFITFALGALHDLELPPHDPSADEYCMLAKACLAEGDLLKRPTMAGVQALVTMGHYHLETEEGRNGDSAWPLWGLAMRLIESMGLHRDGARWELPSEIVEDRRRLFWEAYCIDVFQANCFSRPSAIQRRHIDTLLPRKSESANESGKGFLTAKYELAQISQEILDQAMDVRTPDYTVVQALQDRLSLFERNLPYQLRCREALLAATSLYPDPETARTQSPEVNKRNLRRTLEQYTLALNISENFLFLQRPYFIAASHDSPSDPALSRYGASYLSVVERCNIIIQLVSGLYDLFPSITSRHWFYWYHLFTAAVCFGTILVKHPQNVLAPLALIQMEKTIEIFWSLAKKYDSPSMKRNHELLTRLRNRVINRVSTGDTGTLSNDLPDNGLEDDVVELLGWRTRLINCVTQDANRLNQAPTAHTAQESTDPAASEFLSSLDLLAQPSTEPLIPGNAASAASQPILNPDFQDIWHQFSDTVAVGDGRADPMRGGSLNWWDWDPTIPISTSQDVSDDRPLS
ncbi:hypothetical protein I317_03300 [Kwoniella heveanensis CBS 569]|nr:hypothetical protein I317_03300 [Kwoniella heveanensis CBS 569]